MALNTLGQAATHPISTLGGLTAVDLALGAGVLVGGIWLVGKAADVVKSTRRKIGEAFSF